MTEPTAAPPPLAKPSTPAPNPDPPGIAASVIKKDGQDRTESADVVT